MPRALWVPWALRALWVRVLRALWVRGPRALWALRASPEETASFG